MAAFLRLPVGTGVHDAVTDAGGLARATAKKARMRRPDAQLISRARRGDIAACLEAGRKYLQGTSGFPRHVTLGLEYLQQAERARADDTSSRWTSTRSLRMGESPRCSEQRRPAERPRR